MEDDSIVGRLDKFGMAPEITIGLEGELEDLNVKPLTMDRESDSPHPSSRTQVAVLDSAVQADVVLDTIAATLWEVLLTQLTSSPPPRKEPSPRVVILKLPKSETVPDKASGVKLSPQPMPAASAPTPASYPYLAGRGLLRLRARPKLARIPALRRQPPPCSALQNPRGLSQFTCSCCGILCGGGTPADA